LQIDDVRIRWSWFKYTVLLTGCCRQSIREAELRAVLCNAFEGVKALTIGEAPEPHPGPVEILVDVHAASVSYMDYLMTTGGYQMRPPLPYVPGTDAAGIVVAVGEKVDRFRPGDRVACEDWHGAFAERMAAKASSTAHLPEGIGFVAGSTVLYMYTTAYYALVSRAKLKSGETLV
jgi:NADPH:quinone reductase